jgi:arsenate reductase
MPVTIWHNPKCTTSCKVLETIRAEGISPNIVEYLKTPPDAAEIRTVLREAGLAPRDLLRKREKPYEALGLDDPAVTDEAVVAAMAKHPILIERPVVRTGKGTRLCRPADRVKDIL